MDPITLVVTGGGMLAALLAGSGHAYLLRPPRPSPETVRRAAVGAAAAGVAAGTALGSAAPALADSKPPWTVTAPTVPISAPAGATPAATAAPGPDNPQGDPQQWGRPARPAVPSVQHPAPAARPVAAPPVTSTTRRVASSGRAASGTWRVGPGDSLWSIARAHRTTVAALVAANAGRHPSLRTRPGYIRDGWRLVIPR